MHRLGCWVSRIHDCSWWNCTVHPKKYAHGLCFAVLCCGYTLTDFPISIRLTSLALWQSNDCPSASKATLMNMDKYCMWIYYERLHNHNKAKHNKTVCIFLGIYCITRSLTFNFILSALTLLRAIVLRHHTLHNLSQSRDFKTSIAFFQFNIFRVSFHRSST